MNYWVIALTEEERDLILSLLENREKYCGEAAFQNLPKYQIRYWAEQQHRASMLANRIKGAELNIDGAIYMLDANEKTGNSLHGGFEGFNRKVWDVIEYDGSSILLSYYSPDGEGGFPGGLLTKLRYTLEGATLMLEYEAIPEAKTAIALTNHSFFNLNDFSESVYDQVARIYADTYTEVDETLIPTGEHPSVKGTVYDFSYPKPFGKDMYEGFKGHDVNYVLVPEKYAEFKGQRLALGATVEGRKLVMNCYTDQPGIQLYLANHFARKENEPPFHNGKKPVKNGAFCLEAQTEPDCVSRGEAIYDAGEVYRQFTVYEILEK